MASLINRGDSCRLKVGHIDGPQGEIRIHLDWRHKRNLWKRIMGYGEIDLDLGCYYRLRNGRKTLIDGLQFARGNGGPRNIKTRQGCFTQPPYIWHTGDDPGLSSDSGETILVNPAGLKDIDRLIIYAFIYDGTLNWMHTNAVLRISIPGNDDVEVQVGRQDSPCRFCALVQLAAIEDDTIEITKLITFHEGHSDCDEAYGWGFTYFQQYK